MAIASRQALADNSEEWASTKEARGTAKDLRVIATEATAAVEKALDAIKEALVASPDHYLQLRISDDHPNDEIVELIYNNQGGNDADKEALAVVDPTRKDVALGHSLKFLTSTKAFYNPSAMSSLSVKSLVLLSRVRESNSEV